MKNNPKPPLMPLWETVIQGCILLGFFLSFPNLFFSALVLSFVTVLIYAIAVFPKSKTATPRYRAPKESHKWPRPMTA
jgi:hypothetical protein